MNALSNFPRRLVLRIAAIVLPLVAVVGAAHGDNMPPYLGGATDPTPNGPAYTQPTERIITQSQAFDLLFASDGQLYYVDHFGGELGRLDVDTGQKTALLTGLRAPYHMTEFQNRLYFTEFGTTGAQYRDGALSVFDPQAGTHARLREGLHAAASIEADSAGNLYVLEVPGTSTSFGGINRLLKFPAAGGEFDVLIDHMNLVNPLSLLLDEGKGRLYIGDGGIYSPSDLGSLLAYSLVNGTSETVLTHLPTVWDMEFDGRGNILVAGFGDDYGSLRAVSYIPTTLDQIIPIRTGLDAWTVAADRAGAIYFATGRLEESIRVLSLPVPEPGALWLVVSGLAVLVAKCRATRNRPSRVLQIATAVFLPIAFAGPTRGDIFQWEYINPADPSQGKQQSTVSAPDGAGANALPGAYLAGRDLTLAYFIGANLTNASLASKIESQGSAWIEFPWGYERIRFIDFRDTRLTDADFTGADVRGASFSRGYCPPDTACTHYNSGGGITLAQLYSTASYQARDLSGINLSGNDLAGGDFNGQNLTNAVLGILTGVDLTAADVRGGYGDLLGSAQNVILPNGFIDGLDLNAGGLLIVRDYDGNPIAYPAPTGPIPITVEQHFTMGPGGTLRMAFEADAWDSTISFAPDTPVTLGGTLELAFADDVNLPSQIGRTFDLFNWTGVNPTGAFAVASPYRWDLSSLYTTGKITLAAVPESPNIALAVAGALGLSFFRRRIR